MTRNGLDAVGNILGCMAAVKGSGWLVERRDRVLEEASRDERTRMRILCLISFVLLGGRLNVVISRGCFKERR